MNENICKSCGDAVKVRSETLSMVCPSCGSEDFSDMFESSVRVGVCNFSQLQNGYSRINRFKNYLYSVLGIHFGPGSTSPIWEHLKPCQTMEELVKLLSRSPTKNKHYECLHSYAKVFLANYMSPKPLLLREIEQVKKMFLDIQYAYAQIYGCKTVFFSYPWLLHTILKAMGRDEYLCFVKNLKCKKRAAGYLLKFEECIDHLLDSEKNLSCLCVKIKTYLIKQRESLKEPRPCASVRACTVV